MFANVKTGIDVLEKDGFSRFRKQRLGLIINPSSVNRNLESTLEVFLRNGVKVTAVFGPEHGIRGEFQDQEKCTGFKDEKKDILIYNLYGKHLAPTEEMLKSVDTLVFDIQDVGARYYTFIWTMALAMEKAAQYNKRFVVLDRPNPINGVDTEGPILQKGYESFVGLYPIPIRHGMTAGELALMFKNEFSISIGLDVVRMEDWNRSLWFDETGLRWVPPSPNMPTLDTAIVYPGMCLLEGTNISEGRGTTKPFEYFGAPWLKTELVLKELKELKGCKLRTLHFRPLFGKYRGEICNGFQLYIASRDKFKPVITALEIILAIKKAHQDEFRWKKPPYEFEAEKLPFEILTGNPKVRELIDNKCSIKDIEIVCNEGFDKFQEIGRKYFLYE